MAPDQIEDGEEGGRGGYNHGLAGSAHARLSLDGAYKSIVDIHCGTERRKRRGVSYLLRKK